MSQLIKSENITVVIGQYTDNNGQEKKKYRTIGELVTMLGDDGQPYQFGEIWGPHGVTKFNVYEQRDKNAASTNHQQAPQPYGHQQAPQGQQGYPQNFNQGKPPF